MLLADLKPGVRARVKSIQIQDGMLFRRLTDLGVMEEAEICLLCKAPFGGPVALECEKQSVCIRRSDAQQIRVYLI